MKWLSSYSVSLNRNSTSPMLDSTLPTSTARNAARTNLGGSELDSILFENCHRFLPDELRILKPDVVVTQGSQAENAILRSFAVRRHVVRTIASAPRFRRDAHYETGLIEIGPDMMTSLWLQTFHPSNFGHFNPQRAHLLASVCRGGRSILAFSTGPPDGYRSVDQKVMR